FDRKKVPYKIINVHNNKRLIDEMEQKTGKRTIPQIIINGKHVGGYMSLVGANMTGSLDEMLGLNDNSQIDPKAL
ncbi:MAG TPA: glutaredoxin domain-containing protein, partial [Candidatus Nanoarchaeia archaeon]|nr:glutaredoxin domain-containing protein [Candidatus Nanoarchaeia archaeon]